MRVILLSRVKGNIVLALVILPFLFMIIRLDLLFRHPRRRRGITVVRALETALGAATAALFVFLAVFRVYAPGNPQPISVTENMNLSSNKSLVEVTSPAPIGKISLSAPDLTEAISTRARRYSTTVTGTKPVLQEQISTSSFLDRKRIDLRIEPDGKPYRVSVELSSREQIVIFDSNFPFSYSSTGKQATIHIGANPPFPLDVQFTLPQAANVEVGLKLTYTTLPFAIKVSGKDISVQRSLVVSKTLSVGAGGA